MEGMPKGFDYTEIESTFMEINGVVKIHNLRVWALSLDKSALSAHLAISKKKNFNILFKMINIFFFLHSCIFFYLFF